MIITIQNVTVELDTKAQGLITPIYSGAPKDVQTFKAKLSAGGARGMYGNLMSIDRCFAIDFLSNLSEKFPEFKLKRDLNIYIPEVPDGVMP